MSFCLVSTFYPPASFGGDAIHVRSLARGLASRGHQVRVIHSPEAHRLLGGTSTDGASPPDSDVEVVAVPVGRTATAATVGTYLTGLPLGYKRRLHELTQGFDVVHFHNPSLLGGPGGLTAGSAQALRLYTAMEHWLLCPTHALFRFGREVCTKATCWRCTLSYRRPPQLWRSTRLLETMVDQLDTVITLSRFTAKLHQDAFATCHVEVLPPLFWPEDLGRFGDQLPHEGRARFVFAGRLEPIKGAVQLVQAFSRVHGADLLVIGTGSQEAEVRRLAAENQAVRILGRLPAHDDVLKLLGAATAVVVPSVGYETFGGVAVEAMALGTPVLVRDLGPLPELVEDGGGLVFSDDEDLTSMMQLIVDDPPLARRLGEQAKCSAAARFADNVFFRGYFRIVADTAARRGIKSLAARARSAAVREEQ